VEKKIHLSQLKVILNVFFIQRTFSELFARQEIFEFCENSSLFSKCLVFLCSECSETGIFKMFRFSEECRDFIEKFERQTGIKTPLQHPIQKNSKDISKKPLKSIF
jgi:hypothetical protein